MARSDWKVGRFTSNWETSEIHAALTGYQHSFGDYILYYRFRKDLSQVHAIYDEGTGAGKVFDSPINLGVIHATHQEGLNEDRDEGFYFNDDLHVTCSFDQLVKTGLSFVDLETQKYLKDRIVYDKKVFRVTEINVLGQVQQRDIIVGIDATMLKGDELVNDLQFQQWTI